MPARPLCFSRGCTKHLGGVRTKTPNMAARAAFSGLYPGFRYWRRHTSRMASWVSNPSRLCQWGHAQLASLQRRSSGRWCTMYLMGAWMKDSQDPSASSRKTINFIAPTSTHVSNEGHSHGSTPFMHVKHPDKSDVLMFTQTKVPCQVGKKTPQLENPTYGQTECHSLVEEHRDTMLVGIHDSSNAAWFGAMLLNPIMENVIPYMVPPKNQEGVNQLSPQGEEHKGAGCLRGARQSHHRPTTLLVWQGRAFDLQLWVPVLTHRVDNCLCCGKRGLHTAQSISFKVHQRASGNGCTVRYTTRPWGKRDRIARHGQGGASLKGTPWLLDISRVHNPSNRTPCRSNIGMPSGSHVFQQFFAWTGIMWGSGPHSPGGTSTATPGLLPEFSWCVRRHLSLSWHTCSRNIPNKSRGALCLFSWWYNLLSTLRWGTVHSAGVCSTGMSPALDAQTAHIDLPTGNFQGGCPYSPSVATSDLLVPSVIAWSTTGNLKGSGPYSPTPDLPCMGSPEKLRARASPALKARATSFTGNLKGSSPDSPAWSAWQICNGDWPHSPGKPANRERKPKISGSPAWPCGITHNWAICPGQIGSCLRHGVPSILKTETCDHSKPYNRLSASSSCCTVVPTSIRTKDTVGSGGYKTVAQPSGTVTTWNRGTSAKTAGTSWSGSLSVMDLPMALSESRAVAPTFRCTSSSWGGLSFYWDNTAARHRSVMKKSHSSMCNKSCRVDKTTGSQILDSTSNWLRSYNVTTAMFGRHANVQLDGRALGHPSAMQSDKSRERPPMLPGSGRQSGRYQPVSKGHFPVISCWVQAHQCTTFRWVDVLGSAQPIPIKGRPKDNPKQPSMQKAFSWQGGTRHWQGHARSCDPQACKGQGRMPDLFSR